MGYGYGIKYGLKNQEEKIFDGLIQICKPIPLTF